MGKKKATKKEDRNLSAEYLRSLSTPEESVRRESLFDSYKREVHASRLANAVTKDCSIAITSALVITIGDGITERALFSLALICVVVGCLFMQQSCSQAIDDAYDYYVLYDETALNRKNENRKIGVALDRIAVVAFTVALLALVLL